MKEKYRSLCLKFSNRIDSDYLVNVFSPYYYKYAQQKVHCNTPVCKCPYQKALKYSFVYIDEEKKIMYFVIPKCASTTLRHIFFSNDHSYSMINPEKNLNEYYKFSFVRNPWCRMVSNWKMFTTHPFRIKQLKSMTDKNVTKFEDFVHFSAHNKNHHWQPQVLFLPEKLDFIGRLENFSNDFELLRKTLSELTVEAKQMNQMTRKEYREYYTPSLANFVGELYTEDINAFGYTFD